MVCREACRTSLKIVKRATDGFHIVQRKLNRNPARGLFVCVEEWYATQPYNFAQVCPGSSWYSWFPFGEALPSYVPQVHRNSGVIAKKLDWALVE
jgi:hypothetical protein